MILSSFLFAFMPAGTIIVYVILILVLLIFSALISGSEVAFFSLGPTEKDLLKSEDSRNGNLALKLLEKPQELLATILIVNNFLNVGIVIFSSSLLNKLFHDTGSSTFHFILEVLSITFMILMIGEVIPKVYATKNGLLFAKLMAFPLRSLSSIPPFSWLKSFLVNGTKIIHKYAKYRGVSITTDELEQAILLTKEESTSEEEQKILEGIIKFGNTDVKQIMRSRMEVVYLEEDFDFQIVLNKILEAGYSRIPVIRDSFDQVEGILYVKDLLPHINEKPDFAWKSLIRKPFFVPENKKIDDLLKDFQEKKMHMAIVVDEYGGGSGLVTLEDVLEEIVGDITEEFDEDVVGFKQISPNTYIFEGRTALVDLYKVLEIDGKEFESEKGESDSIGGFIIEQSGRILKNNEFIKFKNNKLIVVSSDKRRIKSVKIVIGQN
jgi:putative hemolysin